MTWAEWLDYRERFPSLAARFAREHPRQVPTPPAPRHDARWDRALRHWTDDEDRILVVNWGATLLRLAKLLNRSPDAIRARAEELALGSPARARDAITLRRFAELSGFSVTKIRNAAAELGMRLAHAPAGRIRDRGRGYAKTIAITPNQAERLLQRMLAGGFIGRTKDWGKNGHPAACVACQRTDRPHKARGKCSRCYSTDATRRARGSRRGGNPLDAGVELAADDQGLLESGERIVRGDDEGDRTKASL